MSLGKFHSIENERLHKALYRFHNDIYFKAAERIKDALTTLHKLEVNHVDVRPICKEYIQAFEVLRSHLESVGKEAAQLRSRLIKENGCEGNCNESEVVVQFELN